MMWINSTESDNVGLFLQSGKVTAKIPRRYQRKNKSLSGDHVNAAHPPRFLCDRYAFTLTMTWHQDDAVSACKLLFRHKMDLTLHSPVIVSKSVADTRLPEVVLACLISRDVREFPKHKRYNEPV